MSTVVVLQGRGSRVKGGSIIISNDGEPSEKNMEHEITSALFSAFIWTALLEPKEFEHGLW